MPVALSAAVAALFVREFANLKIFSPRIYSAFGWLAVAFGVLTVSNVLRVFGFGVVIARIGDLMFVGSAILTLVVAFLAWRRGGNRAAGWFLIAWSLLCIFQIATAVRLLYTRADSAEGIVYYGLAPSMVAAAVLIALGVSDHVRQQSLALTDAERRAQTDPLTGVLNRRSLIERLDSACLRAEARKLPISVLFLDLDHFKQINDTYGHAAGDACLAGIIPPIQAELRQSDVIGRYGGEEFVVILYGADAAAAQPIAERICRRVADIRIEGYGGPIELTCSIGVAASDTPRGVGPAPDRPRRHGGVCRQALGTQPGAARGGAAGLKEPPWPCAVPCASDVPQLLALVRRYWQFEGLGAFDALRLEVLLQELTGSAARGQVWVAERAGTLCGYLVLVYVVSLEHQGLMAEIDEFFVLPEARGAGLGSALLAAAEGALDTRRLRAAAAAAGGGQRGGACFLRTPRLPGPRRLRALRQAAAGGSGLRSARSVAAHMPRAAAAVHNRASLRRGVANMSVSRLRHLSVLALLAVAALASAVGRADIYDEAVAHVGRPDKDVQRDALDHPARSPAARRHQARHEGRRHHGRHRLLRRAPQLHRGTEGARVPGQQLGL